MKLTSMSTDQFTDLVCDIYPAAQRILQDEKLQQLLAGLSKTKPAQLRSRAQKVSYMLSAAGDLIPLLLQDHREDVFQILAAVNQTDVETIHKQPFGVTISQLREALTDTELMQLFTSQGQTGDATSSGSASGKPAEN